MAEPAAAAAADIAADVAAHHAVMLAARERHDAVRTLATLSEAEATDKNCTQLELEARVERDFKRKSKPRVYL